MNDILGFEILPNKDSPRIIDIKIKNETIEKLIFPFKKGVARLRLKSDRKVQLQSNPKYEAVRYTGIHVPVEPNMILEADCSTSPRLKGIFGSMKNQFKN